MCLGDDSGRSTVCRLTGHTLHPCVCCSVEKGKRTGLLRSEIGTLNEGPLHAALKQHYARPGDAVEATVHGYVVDILRGGHIFEVHTGGFSSLKHKLRLLLKDHALTLICPVACERWIVKLPTGSFQTVTRRRSPKHNGCEGIFEKLVSIPELLAHPQFELEVVSTREEEIRTFDGLCGRRRRGWVVVERRLLEIVDSLVLREPGDLHRLIPHTLPQQFQTRDLVATQGWSRRLAQQAAYCLRKSGEASVVGKSGNAIIYSFHAH